MGFYDLDKGKRVEKVSEINAAILNDFKQGKSQKLSSLFADADTHIRKNAYLAVGKIYFASRALHPAILKTLGALLHSTDGKVRQTAINSAGEIGMRDFAAVEKMMQEGLFDEHPSVRNAVIGSMKKMGKKNPKPVLAFAKRFLHHEDKEIRREICHGIELRGRKHPQDILPLLRELQHDQTARVRNTLVHVLGQIAYKEGCLKTVVKDLKTWENKALVTDALNEIVDVHDRYKDFAILTQREARAYIKKNFPQFT